MRFQPTVHRGTLPKVLVVEDDDDTRELVARILDDEARVTKAADGAEALELALADPPDLVVTDVMMPGLDGFELTRVLARHERLRRVPVVILTARTEPRDMVHGINAGARHYLTKPFTPDELIRKVRRALRRPRRIVSVH